MAEESPAATAVLGHVKKLTSLCLSATVTSVWAVHTHLTLPGSTFLAHMGRRRDAGERLGKFVRMGYTQPSLTVARPRQHIVSHVLLSVCSHLAPHRVQALLGPIWQCQPRLLLQVQKRSLKLTTGLQRGGGYRTASAKAE